MKFACKIGFHRWSSWAATSAWRELLPGRWQQAQSRRCRHCGFADTRWGA